MKKRRRSKLPRLVNVEPIVRFMSKTEKRGRCLIWIGNATYRGYGKFMVGPRGSQKTHLAHRWLWEHKTGRSLTGLVLRHKCDTPLCVKMKHLVLGTQKNNIQDALKRGRWPVGSKHWKTVLDEKKVTQIRKLVASGKTQREVGRMFKVSRSSVGYIVRGRTWKHVQ